MLKKGLGSDGGVGDEFCGRGGPLPGIADRSGNSLPLTIPVDVQMIQIPGLVHISEADQDAVLLRDHRMVGQKGTVPLVQIHIPGGPGIQLLRGIVGDVYPVNGIENSLASPALSPG